MSVILIKLFIFTVEIPIYFAEFVNSITDDDVKQFADWFGYNYIRHNARFKPSLWSIRSLVSRGFPITQCIAESFHNRFRILVGRKHLGFYALLNEIKKELNRSDVEFMKIQNGQMKETTKKIYKERAANVEAIYHMRNEYSKTAFLKSLAANLQI